MSVSPVKFSIFQMKWIMQVLWGVSSWHFMIIILYESNFNTLMIKKVRPSSLKNYTQFQWFWVNIDFSKLYIGFIQCEYRMLCFTGSASICRGKQFIIHGNISKNSYECQRYIFGNRYYSFILFILFFKMCLSGKILLQI